MRKMIKNAWIVIGFAAELLDIAVAPAPELEGGREIRLLQVGLAGLLNEGEEAVEFLGAVVGGAFVEPAEGGAVTGDAGGSSLSIF